MRGACEVAIASTYAAAVPRRPLALLTLAGAAVLGGTFLPWLRSGARNRTSYELLGLVDRLGLARGLGGELIRWWPIVPLLVTVAVVAAWWGGRWVVMAFALAAAAVVIAVNVLLRRGADRARLQVGAGPAVAVAGALALVACSMWLIWSGRARSAPREADSVPSPHADSR